VDGPSLKTIELMSTPFGRSRVSMKSTFREEASLKKQSRVKSPGKDFDLPKVTATVTIPQRGDIRELGPLSQEYAQRFKKQHNLLTIPKKPKRMEWFQEEELARGLYEMMMAETDLETMKRQLALESDFNIQDCYRMFDLSDTGQITRRQFEEVFNLLKLFPTSLEIELTLFRYDKDLDGRLNFEEFKEVVLPFDSNYRDLVLRRPSYCSGQDCARLQFFLDTTTAKLKAFLQLLIQTEMRCERVRQDLSRKKEFDLSRAFEAVAVSLAEKDATGPDTSITQEDVSQFLISRSYAPTQKQVKLFFSRLDRFGTGLPRLDDWKQEMVPRTKVPV